MYGRCDGETEKGRGEKKDKRGEEDLNLKKVITFREGLPEYQGKA